MPRQREGVIATYADGDVWIREHRNGSGYQICVTGEKERFRKDLTEAKKLAAELGRRHGQKGAKTPLITALDHLFSNDKPMKWGHSYSSSLQEAAEWLRPDYGKAVGELDRKVIDAAIQRVRAAGVGQSSEDNLRKLWAALLRWAINNDALDPAGVHRATPTIERREEVKVKRSTTEGNQELISRRQVMHWEQLLMQADAAAMITGRWWEALRILFLALVGLRWGEHASLTGADFDLLDKTVNIGWAMRETRHHMWELDYTKNGTVRRTSWPEWLDPLIERRLDEVGPDELMFPGVESKKRRKVNRGKPMLGPANWQDGLQEAVLRELTKTRDGSPIPEPRRHVEGAWMSRWAYDHIWIGSGRAAQYAVKSTVTTVPGKVSSLIYSPHWLRHWCATWLIAPQNPDPALWWHGVGLSVPDAAGAIGDTEETFKRRYVGDDNQRLQRVKAAVRRTT